MIAGQSDHTETRSEIPECNLWYIDMSFHGLGRNCTWAIGDVQRVRDIASGLTV